MERRTGFYSYKEKEEKKMEMEESSQFELTWISLFMSLNNSNLGVLFCLSP